MAVGKLAEKPEGFDHKALTRPEVLERLVHWSKLLAAHDRGTNCVLSRGEITRTLDRWLDELNDLKGR